MARRKKYTIIPAWTEFTIILYIWGRAGIKEYFEKNQDTINRNKSD